MISVTYIFLKLQSSVDLFYIWWTYLLIIIQDNRIAQSGFYLLCAKRDCLVKENRHSCGGV